jgi:hypothetical protein
MVGKEKPEIRVGMQWEWHDIVAGIRGGLAGFVVLPRRHAHRIVSVREQGGGVFRHSPKVRAALPGGFPHTLDIGSDGLPANGTKVLKSRI